MSASAVERLEGYAYELAAFVLEGYSNVEAGEKFDFSPSTIANHLKHPDVQAALKELAQERIDLATRTIDAALIARLSDEVQRKKMSNKELLEIRRELLGPAEQRVKVSRGADDNEALRELYAKLAANPALAEQLGIGGIPVGDEQALPALESGDHETPSDHDDVGSHRAGP